MRNFAASADSVLNLEIDSMLLNGEGVFRDTAPINALTCK
jgi:hypothetical protein